MSKGIETLRHRLTLQVEQLEAHMALLQQNITKGQTSIDSLTEYVRQYAEKLSILGDSPANGLDADTGPVISGLELQSHNHFAGKLMGALKGQVKQNNTNREHLAKALEQMKQLRLQQKTLDVLLEKKRREMELARQRLEQKETDEFANIAHARMQTYARGL
ncbi:MAG: flagellar export protein FliJ [Limnobacter sp.]|nr:flagellar export protein FliJ [Limnobacter sp.]